MSEPNKTLSSPKWWAVAILPVLAAGVLSWFGSQWWQTHENRPRFLEYRVDRINGMLPVPETGDEKMTVTIGKRQVANLSNITLSVINNEDRDFNKAMLIVNIKSSNQDEVIRLVNSRVIGNEHKIKEIDVTVKDRLDQLKLMAEAEKGTSLDLKALGESTASSDMRYDQYVRRIRDREADSIEYVYELNSINRSDQFAFQAEYLFTGEQAPEIEVDLVATSLGIKEQAVRPDFVYMKSSTFRILFWVTIGVSGVVFGILFELMIKMLANIKKSRMEIKKLASGKSND